MNQQNTKARGAMFYGSLSHTNNVKRFGCPALSFPCSKGFQSLPRLPKVQRQQHKNHTVMVGHPTPSAGLSTGKGDLLRYLIAFSLIHRWYQRGSRSHSSSACHQARQNVSAAPIHLCPASPSPQHHAEKRTGPGALRSPCQLSPCSASSASRSSPALGRPVR